MQSNDNFWDIVVLVFVCILLVAMSYAIIDTAAGNTTIELGVPTNAPPVIPLCSKELWLRVKDGCDDKDG